MHSFTTGDITFHHNGGFDGHVTIRKKAEGKPIEAIEVPAEAILNFAAEAVRAGLMTALEQASPEEVLQGRWEGWET